MSYTFDDHGFHYCDMYSMKTSHEKNGITCTIATPQRWHGAISMRRYVIIPKERIHQGFPPQERRLTDEELSELLGLKNPIPWWKHIGFRSPEERHILLLRHERPHSSIVKHCEELSRLEVENMDETQRKKEEEEYKRTVERRTKKKRYRKWIEQEEKKSAIAAQAGRKDNVLPPLYSKPQSQNQNHKKILVQDYEDLFEDVGESNGEEDLLCDDPELFEEEDVGGDITSLPDPDF